MIALMSPIVGLVYLLVAELASIRETASGMSSEDPRDEFGGV